MNSSIAQIARESFLLAGAPEPVVAAMLDRATVSTVARGTTIFSQDDPAEAIYVVIDGWVKLYRISAAGSEAVVGVFTKGHSFGEAVALRGGRYPVFAEAVTDCTLMRISAAAFLGLLRENPDVAISMLTAVYAHLHNLVGQIEQLKARTTPQRVAEFLLDLAHRETGPCSVDLPYDKILIAGRLGMKPESLSRAFAKLKAHGVRIRKNSAEIADVAKLRVFAEDDSTGGWGQG